MKKRRQTWLREYLIETGYAPKRFVGSAQIFDDVKEVADSIRHTLGLPIDWAESVGTWQDALNKIFRSAEKAGILVVRNGVVGNNTRRKLNVAEFRGFVLVDDYAPLIFVNGRDYKAAQMFTLAHELAHLWLGSSGVFDLAFLQPADHDIERICNKIAAEFLVPTELLYRHLPKHLSRSDYATVLQDLARRFKVSPLVIGRRVLDMGLISNQMYRTYYDEYLEVLQKRELRERDDGGGDFYHNQNYRVGRLFFTYVANAVKENKLLYREAYRLTG
ncbi:MAG: ImmA/IrrE family metallo-endopeptidase [Firmicutes bacterium]|nr:ImmA/IrrE family metallo-endopeptidase [Bacillota bacterium]